ncbi:MAG: archaemetzincin family Zn-dependent metalloprotease [Candidatus Bathyarchaeota archaeon]|nr:archaemetzincin family Zn-dependent metalloprotease [Candidatus Bathyarchaeota archaeon]
MKVGILPIAKVDTAILRRMTESLEQIFPDTICKVIAEKMPLLDRAFDKKRRQYRSNVILTEIQAFAAEEDLDRVLGVVDVDIFEPELNFVFGEASCPGKAALISLFRLRPEFYGASADEAVFLARAVKEAVHELGHTLGLRHCPRVSCVMHFSNSIFDTDKKQSLFCDDCYLQAALSISNMG